MKNLALGTMVEMVEDKLVLDVSKDLSAIACLRGGAEVVASKIVLKSKNGGIAKIPVEQLGAIKEKMLILFRELAANHFTKTGLEMSLNGDVLIRSDIFWIKSETEVIPQRPLPISGEIPFQPESVLLLAREK